MVWPAVCKPFSVSPGLALPDTIQPANAEAIMTVDLFQFSHRPFAATCNVANYVPFESIEGALDSVSGNVRRGAGTAVVIGPAGLGKTMFCQVLASRLAETHEIVMLATSSLCTRRALLQNVLFELGLPYRDRDEGELRLGLLDHLRSKHNNSQGMLMIVDEAQTMPLRLLEEVRVLSNISRDGRPRVHLVFTGNQSFEERLNHPKLDAIQQRISARSYLFPMNREETLRFVSRQWAQAAAGVRLPFTAEALQQIHDASEGIPRLVNQLCDHALMLASARGVGDIADSLVAEAWADLQQLPTPWQVNHQDTPLSLGKTPATVIEFGSLDSSRPWGEESPRTPSTESTAMARLDELEELTTDVLEVETAATETDSVVEFSSPRGSHHRNENRRPIRRHDV
ncbi:MAG: AAA family ATPase [Pirellulaceae bacterium]